MKYVFYITNHGFGHASRNVPLIKYLLDNDSSNYIYIKSDKVRCDFIRRNLESYSDRVEYYVDCNENGIILKSGQLMIDVDKTKETIIQDLEMWSEYVDRESTFLNSISPDVVVSDIIPWALKAADNCKIKSVLIGSFTWVEMYWDYYNESVWKPYLDCYKLAKKALWYEIHNDVQYSFCDNYECVSLVSRLPDNLEVQRIIESHKQPIVFFSLGGSAELNEPIDVTGLPYDFVATRGIELIGDNVYYLPMNMINTPDYIAASEIVIAKGGWSTVAEILLQKKKCGLLFRGNNSEDINTKNHLIQRNQCVEVNMDDLKDMGNLLKRINDLEPVDYSIYSNDVEKICDIINNL